MSNMSEITVKSEQSLGSHREPPSPTSAGYRGSAEAPRSPRTTPQTWPAPYGTRLFSTRSKSRAHARSRKRRGAEARRGKMTRSTRAGSRKAQRTTRTRPGRRGRGGGGAPGPSVARPFCSVPELRRTLAFGEDGLRIARETRSDHW